MYYVVVKAVVTAVRGPRVGWGKLERRATAAVEQREKPARAVAAAKPRRL
jgi:hypothetical protein